MSIRMKLSRRSRVVDELRDVRERKLLAEREPEVRQLERDVRRAGALGDAGRARPCRRRRPHASPPRPRRPRRAASCSRAARARSAGAAAGTAASSVSPATKRAAPRRIPCLRTKRCNLRLLGGREDRPAKDAVGAGSRVDEPERRHPRLQARDLLSRRGRAAERGRRPGSARPAARRTRLSGGVPRDSVRPRPGARPGAPRPPPSGCARPTRPRPERPRRARRPRRRRRPPGRDGSATPARRTRRDRRADTARTPPTACPRPSCRRSWAPRHVVVRARRARIGYPLVRANS